MKKGYSYETVIGELWIYEEDNLVTDVSFKKLSSFVEEETSLIKEVIRQLNEYFTGKRKIFDLPLNAEGTEFQQKVWTALLDIPYGKTCTYKQIAEVAGNSKASRAVGMSNNRNPIMVIIPCHRVIGASGKMVGYAGGLDAKRFLLDLEQSTGRLRFEY